MLTGLSQRKPVAGGRMDRAWHSRAVRVVLCTVVVAICAGFSGRLAPGGVSAMRSAPAAACTPSTPASTSTSGARLADASNRFGFNLFHRLLAGAPKSDIFVSPLSVALALDMLYDGARGGTASAMARTLALGGMTQQEVSASAATLLHSLQIGEAAPPNHRGAQPTKLRVANSMWSRSGLAFRPQFISDLQRYFGAQARSIDFNSPSAPSTINGWVSCETNGRIKQIVNSTASLIMVLINAVYFQGQWSWVFDPKMTTRQAFTTGSGSTIRVRMMHQTVSYGYYQGRDFKALTMPYGSGRFSMVVVLPKRGVSLQKFAPRLTSTNWGYWVQRMSKKPLVDVAFPHIDFSYATDLTPALSDLGMRVAFGPQANLSGVCTSFCEITKALHKTFLHVDEHGTTAAAVTALGGGGGGGHPRIFHFVANHPFFLAIRDRRSGSVLFLGAVSRP